MRYSALHDFYKVNEAALYAAPIDFKLMTTAQLNAIVESGMVAWEAEKARLRAEAHASRLKSIVEIIAVVTAGVALAASGMAAAAAPGVNAVATGAGTAAATSAASAAAATAVTTANAGIWATVKSVAGYVGKISAVAGKVTGNDNANKLAATANLINTPSWGDAVKQGTEFVLKNQGEKIDEKNEDAKAAANELIRREQDAYAAKLREMAAIEAQKSHVEIKQPDPITVKDMLPYIMTGVMVLLKLS
jgi:hypothetical protein